ncbi:hypothetical protein ON010_g9153 [Phytophthora cinnamomi]|nr:hypothetical protein ON010_g9153 [Phytophthora cinnamomi]
MPSFRCAATSTWKSSSICNLGRSLSSLSQNTVNHIPFSDVLNRIVSPKGGEGGRGHLRHRVQGPGPDHGPHRGPQEDPPGARRGGHPVHRHARDLAAQGAVLAPERRVPVRRRVPEEQALPGLRVRGAGPQALPREAAGQDGGVPGQELPVPVAGGHRLLPRQPRAAPRPQAAEPAYRPIRQP